jgi:hypothetical protein
MDYRHHTPGCRHGFAAGFCRVHGCPHVEAFEINRKGYLEPVDPLTDRRQRWAREREDETQQKEIAR